MLRTSQFNTIHGDRPNVRNVAVIITDGEPTLRVNDTFIQAQLAKDAGIEVCINICNIYTFYIYIIIIYI